MKFPPSNISKALNDHKNKKEVMHALKRLHQSPTIKHIIKVEEVLQKPVLKYIIGDIEYDGPNDVDVNSAKSIFPYINRFFDIERMIRLAVHEFNFWQYIHDLIVNE